MWGRGAVHAVHLSCVQGWPSHFPPSLLALIRLPSRILFHTATMEPQREGEVRFTSGSSPEELQQRAAAANAVIEKGLKELQLLEGES